MTMKDKYIIYAIGQDKNDIYYISNVDPILWTSKKEESKIFYSYQQLKAEILYNFKSFENIIKTTNITSIMVSHYNNNIEIERLTII